MLMPKASVACFPVFSSRALAHHVPVRLHALCPVLCSHVCQGSYQSCTLVQHMSGPPGPSLASSGLPPIPAKLVQAIKEGKFVDFGDLLPEALREHAFEVVYSQKDEKKKKAKSSIFHPWQIGPWPTLSFPLLWYTSNRRKLSSLQCMPPSLWVWRGTLVTPRSGYVMIACSGSPRLLTQHWNGIGANPTCG